MKSTVFTFLMFIGITLFSQAGNVVFFTEDGDLFFVSMNGVKINSTPMANVLVPGVKAPGAMVTITFADASLGVIKKNVMAADGREYTYKVKKNKKGQWKIHPFTDIAMSTISTTTTTASDPVLIQQKADPIVEVQPVKEEKTQTTTTVDPVTTNTTVSNTSVQSNANPATGNGISLNINVSGTGTQSNPQQTTANTTVQNGTAITTTTTSNTTTNTNTVNTTQQNIEQPNKTGVSLSLNINTNGLNSALNTMNTNVTTNTTDVTTTNDVVVTDNSTQTQTTTTTPVNDVVVTSSNTSGCTMVMDAGEFSAAKSSVSSKSFEDSRMKVAKQITENNCLSTTQVKEIMGLFSFEGSKLDYAKFAYAYTYDKNNYYKINDAFGFESSIDELQTYIKENK